MFEYLPYFVSMLFTMALIVYSLFLLYTLYLEQNSTLSQLFVLLCLAMAVWSMSYAISASAETIFVARRWHRVAVWGHGTVYSLFLHFIIILTKNNRVFKHKIVYGLIYIPSLLNLLFYSIKTPWVTYEYNLKQLQLLRYSMLLLLHLCQPKLYVPV